MAYDPASRKLIVFGGMTAPLPERHLGVRSGRRHLDRAQTLGYSALGRRAGHGLRSLQQAHDHVRRASGKTSSSTTPGLTIRQPTPGPNSNPREPAASACSARHGPRSAARGWSCSEARVPMLNSATPGPTIRRPTPGPNSSRRVGAARAPFIPGLRSFPRAADHVRWLRRPKPGREYFNDTWAYHPAANTWTKFGAFEALRGSSSNWGPSLVFDPSGDRLIMFGGGPPTAGFNDTRFATSSAMNSYKVFLSHTQMIKRPPCTSAGCSKLKVSGVGWPPATRSPGRQGGSGDRGHPQFGPCAAHLLRFGQLLPLVLREIERAVAYERPVLSIHLDDAVPNPSLEYYLNLWQWLEARARSRTGARRSSRPFAGNWPESPDRNCSEADSSAPSETTQEPESAAHPGLPLRSSPPRNGSSPRRSILWRPSASGLASGCRAINAPGPSFSPRALFQRHATGRARRTTSPAA